MPGTPTKSEILTALEAQAESTDAISKRLQGVEASNEKQQERNQTITYAVLFAFIAIVVAVAVQISTTEKRDWSHRDSLIEQVHKTEFSNLELKSQLENYKAQLQDLRNQLDALRARNSYLR